MLAACRTSSSTSAPTSRRPRAAAAATRRLRILDSQVERLEREIDALNAELAPLTSFVLPGGIAGRAALHLARTVCRRAERAAVAFVDAREDGAARTRAALRYLNRLSDLLFVAARYANDQGARGDVLWARRRRADQRSAAVGGRSAPASAGAR